MTLKKTTSKKPGAAAGAGATGADATPGCSKGSRSARCASDEPNGRTAAAKNQGEQCLPRLAAVAMLLLAFLAGVAFKSLINIGLPTIRIEWPQREADSGTALAKWIKKNRPALEADYPAVGAELAAAAERLESGRLIGPIDAAADTVARVQPVVSDAAVWREFISKLTGRFQGEDGAALAAEYREAAGAFGVVKAVEALIDTGEIEHEESTAEAAAEAGDCGGDLESERPDEGTDQPDRGGPDYGNVPGDDGQTPGAGAEYRSGCPGGQCPTRSAAPVYRSNPWPFWW